MEEIKIMTKQEEVEKERIRVWREKEAKNSSVTWEKKIEGKKITIDTKPNGANITQQEHSEIHRATLCAITGSANQDYGRVAFSQTTAAHFTNEVYDHATVANALSGVLLSMNPKDEIEGMICSRLPVLNNQAMHFLSKATTSGISENRVDLYINRATKLIRVFNESLDALSKYRRNGEQKVTVQHINVNGGQAVVGNVTTGGRGEHDKK